MAVTKQQLKIAGIASVFVAMLVGTVIVKNKNTGKPVAPRPVAAPVAVRSQPVAQPVQSQPQQSGYSNLIVKTNNSAAAHSCYIIVLTAANTLGNSASNQELQTINGAMKSFMNMYTQSRTGLLMQGQTQAAVTADQAGDVTVRRINALDPSVRRAEVLAAANQCISVL